MGIFDKVLSADQTLFKNSVALDYDYVPKLMPFRDNEQFTIAKIIRPLFAGRDGMNAIVTGKPGIGKTLALTKVLEDLEEHEDEAEIDIIPLYLNCWKKNSTYKVMLEICTRLEYKFTHNKKTDELFDVVKKILNKGAAVFVFDEIDKADDTDFLYMILDEIYKKSVILITNDAQWVHTVDKRIRSRLLAETVTFRPYTRDETASILRERANLAFYEGVCKDDALQVIAEKAHELKDIRTGLFLMEKSANTAEDEGSKTIEQKHVDKALQTLDDFSKKKQEQLEPDEQIVLSIVKEHSGKKIGQLYEHYQQKSTGTYKTFQRRIERLVEGGYISVKKIKGGPEGSTTIVDYSSLKKLTEF